MRCLPITLSALILAACSAAPGPAHAGSSAPDSQVVFDIRTWGKLISHWEVGADGTGEIWRASEGPLMSAYDIRKFHLRMDAPTLARFQAASDAFKRATRRPIACKYTITDADYGEIVWSGRGAPQSFRFNFGCLSPAMNRAFDMINQVHAVVSKQAAIDTEPFAIVHNGQ